MLLTQTLLRHKAAALIAVFLMMLVAGAGALQSTAFAASVTADDWFRQTGAVSESNVWKRNGVQPDVGVAVAFGAAITNGGGQMSQTWDCGKNASSGDQQALSNFGSLLATGYYNNDAAVKQAFPGFTAAKFKSAAQKVIAGTLAASGGLDNDNKSRCTYVADRMRDNGLLTKSADQARADLADTIAAQCGPVWSESIKLDSAQMITVYYNLMMGLSSKDWNDKVVKPYNNSLGANQCSDVLAASKLNNLSIKMFQSELQKTCQGNDAQLKRIDGLSDLQLAKAYSKVKDGSNCKDSIDFAISDATSGADGTADDVTTCAVDGIGWIVCPVMNFIAKMNDAAFGFLQNMLGIRADVITSKSTQTAWAAFRDIANVAFVIAFMVIVYSQLTSAGISNYGIKKMLPRIVIAAILVNASYIICAVAVDISNIVGSSLYTLMKDSISVGKDVSPTGWEDSISGILEVAATAAGIILLVVAVAMAPMVLLAFVLVILILVARQALVILLIVVAPLAFVAYLLPNTESWFKKWWKALVTTLMVYPIVAMVFGASTLASKVLTEVAASEPDQNMLMLIALGVLAVPLFAVPAILKAALSATGSIGNKIAGLQDRANRATSKQFGNRAKQMGGGIRDAANRRAWEGEGFLGRRGVGSVLRSRRRREEKYTSLSDRANSAGETFANSDEKASAYRRASAMGKETAELTTKQNVNAAKSQHLLENHALHDDAHQSDLRLKDEQAVHSGQSTQAYVQNNAALRTAAVQSGINASNAEETVKNDATAAHVAANSGAGGQYEQLNRSQGELEIARSDSKNTFEDSGVGRNIADRKATTGVQGNIIQKRAETRAVEQNRDLNVQATAATDTLEAAKADESAFVQELKTIDGADQYLAANQGQAAQDLIKEIRSADTTTRVQTQRKASAANMVNVEYASEVKASEGTRGGLADIAGGVDPAGASRAVAVATQVIDKQLTEAVAAQKTTLESTKNDLLKAEFESGYIEGDIAKGRSSSERLMAVAGTIASRGYMGGKLDLLKETGRSLKRARADARARGVDPTTDPTVQALRYSQKQISSDMRDWPFGASDTMRDQLALGEWEGDFDSNFQARIGSKLTGEKLGTLKAEEFQDLENIFTSLTPDQKASLDNAVEEARTIETVRKNIKPEVWASLERMGYSRPSGP